MESKEIEDDGIIFHKCSLLASSSHNFNSSLCDTGLFALYSQTSNFSSVNSEPFTVTTQHIISMIVQSLFIVFFLGGVLGNLTVLYVVTKFSKVKSVTNFYIVNLALSDTLFLMGIPFIIVTYVNKYWIFGNLICKFYLVNTSLNQYTSSLFLTIMSADRYIAVCHPINAPKYRTPLISKLVAVTAWTLASLMIAPVLMYATTHETTGIISCNIFWPNSFSITGTHMFIMYSFILSFVLPVVLIFSFYTLVIWKLRSSCSDTLKMQIKDRRRPKRSRVTRLVLALIAVYICCWLPYWILQLALLNDEPRKSHGPFMIICFHIISSLEYANSAINPILYTFLSDNFKNSFREAFNCFKQCKLTRGRKSTPLVRKVESLNMNRTRTKKNINNDGAQLAALSSDENRLSGSSHNGLPLIPRDAFPEKHSGISQL